jgi:hypothetical protein
VLIALLCALIAMALSGVTAAFVMDAGDGTSSLVHMSQTDPISSLARRADPDFGFVPTTSHYDGTYFYAVGRDPFARGDEHNLIDRGAYRYGHPFYGQLAGLFSAGNPSALPLCLLLVSVVAMGVGAAGLSLLAAGWGRSPWLGLAVAFSPGLLYAVTADTAEPLVVALLALSLLAWRARRFAWAAFAFVLLALTKEPMSLVPVGVFAYEAAGVWRRDRTLVPAGWVDVAWRWRVATATTALAAGPVVLFGWLAYVDKVFGRWPLGNSDDLIGGPFGGIRDTARQAARLVGNEFAYAQLGAIALPLLIALFGLFAAGIACALRFRTIADGVFLATAPLMFLLGPKDLLYPKDLLRITVVPVLLLPFVLLAVRRARSTASSTALSTTPPEPPLTPGGAATASP